MHTLPVVPEPAKKSKTVEPSYDKAFTNLLINSTGFWVGCPTRSEELPLSRPISHTFVGFLPFSTLSGLSLLSLNAAFLASSS